MRGQPITTTILHCARFWFVDPKRCSQRLLESKWVIWIKFKYLALQTASIVTGYFGSHVQLVCHDLASMVFAELVFHTPGVANPDLLDLHLSNKVLMVAASLW